MSQEMQFGKVLKNAFGSFTITFDKPFASVPVVVTTASNQDGNTPPPPDWSILIETISKEGFTINNTSSNYVNYVVNWIAISS